MCVFWRGGGGGEEPKRQFLTGSTFPSLTLAWEHGIFQCSAQSSLSQVLLQHSKSKKIKDNVLITFVLV